jgi:hypothetical protein
VDGGGNEGEETLRGRVGTGVGVAMADSIGLGRAFLGTLPSTKNRTLGTMSAMPEIGFFKDLFCIRKMPN